MPYSTAAVLVNPSTPCFAAVYAGAFAKPMAPRMEATFTMGPPPVFTICAISYFMQRKTPAGCGDHVFPSLQRVVGGGGQLAPDPRVVGGDVEAPIDVHCAPHQGRAILGACHVACREQGLASGLAHVSDGPLTAVPARVGHHHLGTGACIRQRDGPAEAC